MPNMVRIKQHVAIHMETAATTLPARGLPQATVTTCTRPSLLLQTVIEFGWSCARRPLADANWRHLDRGLFLLSLLLEGPVSTC